MPKVTILLYSYKKNVVKISNHNLFLHYLSKSDSFSGDGLTVVNCIDLLQEMCKNIQYLHKTFVVLAHSEYLCSAKSKKEV